MTFSSCVQGQPRIAWRRRFRGAGLLAVGEPDHVPVEIAEQRDRRRGPDLRRGEHDLSAGVGRLLQRRIKIANHDIEGDERLRTAEWTDPTADALPARVRVDERVVGLRDLVHLPAEHGAVETARLRRIGAVDLEIGDRIAHETLPFALWRLRAYVSLHLPTESSLKGQSFPQDLIR